MAAHRSWVGVFDRIFYFGSHCAEMSDPSVRFMASEQFPSVSSLVGFAAGLPGWSAISNADIVVRGDMRRLLGRLVRVGAKCAVTRRYEFTGQSFGSAKVVDLGMDFFMASQATWSLVLSEYPERYRFGHSSWDALMLGAFNCVARKDCYDVTMSRFCFHPRHGERRSVFHIDDTARTRFRDAVFFPPRRAY